MAIQQDVFPTQPFGLTVPKVKKAMNKAAAAGNKSRAEIVEQMNKLAARHCVALKTFFRGVGAKTCDIT